MATFTVDTWVCDRCQLQVDVTRNEQPPGWGSVQGFAPPLASPDADGAGERKHLCRRCRDDLDTFLNTPPPKDED